MSVPALAQAVSSGNQDPPKIEPKYEIDGKLKCGSGFRCPFTDAAIAGLRVDPETYLRNYTGTTVLQTSHLNKVGTSAAQTPYASSSDCLAAISQS